MVLKYPVFYMYLHKELERAANRNIVLRKRALKQLREGHKISTPIAVAILKEMENHGLITKQKFSRYDAYKVNAISAVNVVEHTNKIYEELGIF